MRRLGLCVVAILALCGLLATTASAETLPKPVWATCQKASPKDTGKFKNKTCSEAEPAGKGDYELKEGVGKGKAFKGKTGKHETAELIVKVPQGTFPIKCLDGGKDEGTPVAPNLEKKVSASFSKCEFLEKVCTTAGAKKGEIKVTGLEGELGYIEEGATPKVGVQLKAEAADGVMSEFNCEETAVRAKIEGEVIGEETKQVGVISKDSDAIFAPGEFYGEHEFGGKQYKPIVNIIGFAVERPEIERCEAERDNCEEEWPAHVVRGIYCGAFVYGVLSEECTPPTYTGLAAKFVNKGEALEIKV
jgi:hypothetical protein